MNTFQTNAEPIKKSKFAGTEKLTNKTKHGIEEKKRGKQTNQSRIEEKKRGKQIKAEKMRKSAGIEYRKQKSKVWRGRQTFFFSLVVCVCARSSHGGCCCCSILGQKLSNIANEQMKLETACFFLSPPSPPPHPPHPPCLGHQKRFAVIFEKNV